MSFEAVLMIVALVLMFGSVSAKVMKSTGGEELLIE